MSHDKCEIEEVIINCNCCVCEDKFDLSNISLLCKKCQVQSDLYLFRKGRINKWINVKDNLPEKSHINVLVTDGKKITIAYIGNDLISWFDYFDCFHHAHICSPDILYWMYLPEVPNE